MSVSPGRRACGRAAWAKHCDFIMIKSGARWQAVAMYLNSLRNGTGSWHKPQNKRTGDRERAARRLSRCGGAAAGPAAGGPRLARPGTAVNLPEGNGKLLFVTEGRSAQDWEISVDTSGK
eukprot:384621-Hanusia_phi.AAC.1